MVYKFEFKMPGTILCVQGGAARLGRAVDRLGGGRVLVVTDNGVERAGLVEGVVDGIGRGGAVVAGVFNEVPPNPDVETVKSCRDGILEAGADCILSVGGGSVIDTSKASLILLEGGELSDYELKEYFASGPVIPHVAIPTTAGTGSESTRISMIVDSREKRKLIFHGVDLAPRLAVLDPLMTVTLPPGLTASTGIDALTHAIEALHSKVSEPITDALAIMAIELVSTYLKRAYREGGDIEARSNMLIASNMAGVAASNAFVGIVHAMSHSVGARCGIPHGVATAILLPYGMEHNMRFEGVPPVYRKVAVALGIEVKNDDDVTAAMKAVERIRELTLRLGLPRKLGDVGVPVEALGSLAEDAMRDRSMVVNPGETDQGQMLQLLESAF